MKFLDGLDSKQSKKVIWTLQLIEEQELVSTQYFKKLVNTDDLWEVRIASGSNIFRLLGFFDGSKLVVISHAFQKKTQKTPKHAIEIAEQRKRDYFRKNMSDLQKYIADRKARDPEFAKILIAVMSNSKSERYLN